MTRERHLPFEGFLEALCRVASLKALPTDNECEARGFANAAAWLRDMRDSSPEAYDRFVIERRNGWHQPPRQPLDRCVHHLLCVIVFHIESNTRGADDLELSEKEVDLFFGAILKGERK